MFEYIEDDILVLRRKDLYPITNFKSTIDVNRYKH